MLVLPSKELLSEVLAEKVTDIVNDKTTHKNMLQYEIKKRMLDNSGIAYREIDIHELAHKCKEWAWSNHKLSIISGYTISGNIVANIMIKHMNMCEHHYKADTEPEAIFKACEWILKEHQCNQLT